MKKILLVAVVISTLLSACTLPGTNAKPTGNEKVTVSTGKNPNN